MFFKINEWVSYFYSFDDVQGLLRILVGSGHAAAKPSANPIQNDAFSTKTTMGKTITS